MFLASLLKGVGTGLSSLVSTLLLYNSSLESLPVRSIYIGIAKILFTLSNSKLELLLSTSISYLNKSKSF